MFILKNILNRKSKKFLNTLLAFLLLIPITTSCSKEIINSLPTICFTGTTPCLQGKAIIVITTNKGVITLELDGDNSPVTAGNFLDLINKGVYENTVFHRVIRIPVPFVVQGGDPMSKDPNTPKINYGKGSFIDPKNGQVRFVPLEIKLKTEEFPRYNQLITNPRQLSELQLTHQKGSLAMARSQTANSGSSQFYIALKPLPELDGRYSIFGKIIEGIDVLDEIREGDLILKTKIIQD